MLLYSSVDSVILNSVPTNSEPLLITAWIPFETRSASAPLMIVKPFSVSFASLPRSSTELVNFFVSVSAAESFDLFSFSSLFNDWILPASVFASSDVFPCDNTTLVYSLCKLFNSLSCFLMVPVSLSKAFSALFVPIPSNSSLVFFNVDCSASKRLSVLNNSRWNALYWSAPISPRSNWAWTCACASFSVFNFAEVLAICSVRISCFCVSNSTLDGSNFNIRSTCFNSLWRSRLVLFAVSKAFVSLVVSPPISMVIPLILFVAIIFAPSQTVFAIYIVLVRFAYTDTLYQGNLYLLPSCSFSR